MMAVRRAAASADRGDARIPPRRGEPRARGLRVRARRVPLQPDRDRPRGAGDDADGLGDGPRLRHHARRAGVGWTTLEVKANFTRALTAETGVVRCTGSVIHPGRTGRDDRGADRGRRGSALRPWHEHDPRASAAERGTLSACAATRKGSSLSPVALRRRSALADAGAATHSFLDSRPWIRSTTRGRRSALAAGLGGGGPLRGRAGRPSARPS